VPEVVQADGWQLRLREQLPEQPVRKVRGLNDAAVRGGEHQLVLVLPAHQQLPLRLHDPVTLERAECPLADRDRAILTGLGGAEGAGDPLPASPPAGPAGLSRRGPTT
jgi:hypothetical protein